MPSSAEGRLAECHGSLKRFTGKVFSSKGKGFLKKLLLVVQEFEQDFK